MEDRTGRVVVVTGASSGIGLAAAREFARRGDQVVLVGRHPGRLAAARETVPGAVAHQADFAVLDEVRALAERLRTAYPAIHVLANNAGAILHRRQISVDGFELTLQANHLAPFLLANLLLDRLCPADRGHPADSAGGRIVVTSSAIHAAGAVDPADLRGQRPGYHPMRAYAASKQANILFAAEAARRWPGVLTTSYHPGVVRTRFGNENRMFALFYRTAPLLRTPDQGADTLVWLATAPAADITNGGYYVRRRPRPPARGAADHTLAAQLWEASLAAVGLT